MTELNMWTICITYVPTKEQTANIYTKRFPRPNFDDFSGMFDIINIYDPTQGVLKSKL